MQQTTHDTPTMLAVLLEPNSHGTGPLKDEDAAPSP